MELNGEKNHGTLNTQATANINIPLEIINPKNANKKRPTSRWFFMEFTLLIDGYKIKTFCIVIFILNSLGFHRSVFVNYFNCKWQIRFFFASHCVNVNESIHVLYNGIGYFRFSFFVFFLFDKLKNLFAFIFFLREWADFSGFLGII